MSVQFPPLSLLGASSEIALDFLLTAGRDKNKPLEPWMVQGFVALASSHGWSPEGTITTSRENQSLLEWLSAHPKDWGPSREEAWPLTVEGFEGLATLENPPALNDEWLIALTVASGASPWATTVAPMAPSLAHALKHQQWALVHQMLSIPGAPTLQVVLDSEGDLPGFPRASSWGAWFASQSLVGPGAIGLARLLNQHPYVPRLDVWEAASVGMVQLLVEQGVRPSEESLEGLQKGWQARTRKGTLSLPDHAQMVAGIALSGTDGPTSSYSLDPAALIQAELGTKWDASVFDKVRRETQEEAGVGAAFLRERQTFLKAGLATSGTWSVLASKCWGRLRCVSIFNKGVEPLPLRLWLKGTTGDAALGSLPRGCLSESVSGEWRPGIGLKGMVALAILGQQTPLQLSQKNILDEQPLPYWGDLKDWQDVLDIHDWESWSQHARADAVKFTEEVMRTRSPTGAQTMCIVWNQALRRHPQWLHGEPALQARLLRALTLAPEGLRLSSESQSAFGKGYVLSEKTAIDPSWAQVLLRVGASVGITAETASVPPPFSRFSPSERDVLVEMALVLQSPAWLDALSVAAGRGELEKHHADRLMEWSEQYQRLLLRKTPDEQQKLALNQSGLAQLKAAAISVGLPAPQARNTGPRF